VSANDDYHPIVVRALQKTGWQVVLEQVPLRIANRRLWIDIQAIKNDGSVMVLIEVKSLEGDSPVQVLRDALGQYLLYKAALKYTEYAAVSSLYLAIPEQAYYGIISEPLGEIAIQEADANLIVFNIENEEIVKWIP
jgi:hypothetical protein